MLLDEGWNVSEVSVSDCSDARGAAYLMVAKQLEPLGRKVLGEEEKEKSQSVQHVTLKPAVTDKKLLKVACRHQQNQQQTDFIFNTENTLNSIHFQFREKIAVAFG